MRPLRAESDAVKVNLAKIHIYSLIDVGWEDAVSRLTEKRKD